MHNKIVPPGLTSCQVPPWSHSEYAILVCLCLHNLHRPKLDFFYRFRLDAVGRVSIEVLSRTFCVHCFKPNMSLFLITSSLSAAARARKCPWTVSSLMWLSQWFLLSTDSAALFFFLTYYMVKLVLHWASIITCELRNFTTNCAWNESFLLGFFCCNTCGFSPSFALTLFLMWSQRLCGTRLSR